MTRPTVVGIALALACWVLPAHATGPSAAPSQPPAEAPCAQQRADGAAPGAFAAAGREPLEIRAFRATQDHPLSPHALRAAALWDLDVWLLWALLWVESGWDCTKVNPKSGAAGCGQHTGSGIRGVNNLRRARGDRRPFTRALAHDPREGTEAAAELLAYWINRFGVRRGVERYNGGKNMRGFGVAVFQRLRQLRLAAGLPPEAPHRKRPPRRPPLTVAWALGG